MPAASPPPSPAETTSGIHFALALDGKGGVAPGPAGGRSWIHLDWHACTDWLSTQPDLDPLVVAALMADDTSPRFHTFDDGAILILRGANHNPGQDPDDMVSLRLWMSPERLISVSLRRVLAVDQVHERLIGGRGPAAPVEVALALAGALADNLKPVVRAISERLEDLEDSALDTAPAPLRGDLVALKRQVIWLHRFVRPQAEALDELAAAPPPWFPGTAPERAIEIAHATERLAATLDTQREHSGLILDQLRDRQAEAVATSGLWLTRLAAVFLPLNLLAALFGANVGGIPGDGHPLGFWLLGLGCLIVGGLAGTWFLVRRGDD
ncbi:CorA family divalent cation transporter [Roseospirillum parvum]|uniref:Zinc transporter n=1 Tax=Roseospirillum parvum TaxID=83401 RepID=A0A1G7Y3Z2_9PROT|nr:CorA family divalent cation transporter [Roseospirillum parvum]SDG91175.1 zinc transporter [Roseospirillum parvum]